MKKTITTALATLGVLAAVSMPVMANAATVSHANTLITSSAASSYTVNPFSLTSGSATNAWGTDTLTADDASQEFDWQVSPANSTVSYTYNLVIDIYTTTIDHSYITSVSVPTTSGAGVLSGAVSYPSIYQGPGSYLAKLSGSWTGSDGTSGSVGTASATIRYAI